MLNAFTVDLEDWYHGVGIPEAEWHRYEKRLRIGFDKLMHRLSRHNVKATFFVLGKVIEEYPDIIKEVIDGGHEIGCHTYTHTELYYLDAARFEKEIQQCIQLLQPFGKSYTGFRAPYFSIDKRSWWALDVLKKQDFLYDASIYPGDSKRTGIPGFRKDIHRLEAGGLWEAPVSTFKFLSFDLGLGGAFFRIMPYTFFAKKIKELNKKSPGIFYIHPWELDEKHPVLPGLSMRRRIPHYFNLSKTESKLDRLLDDFEFCPLINLIEKKEKQ